MAFTDHGDVTGVVAVDASSAKVHRFNLIDDDALIQAPSGCSDGDEVTFIFTCAGQANHTAAIDFNAQLDASPNPRYGLSVRISLIKLGTKWV